MNRKPEWGRRRVDNQPYPKVRGKEALPTGLMVVCGTRREEWRQPIPSTVSAKIPDEWEATRKHWKTEHDYLPLKDGPFKIIGQDIFYHITSDSNLEGIARDGLVPQWDGILDAKELPEGTLINLALSRDDVDFIIGKLSGVMLRRHGGSYFPVILKVIASDAYLVHGTPKEGGRYAWAITATKIPPENIEVVDVPWEKQKPYLGEVQAFWGELRSES